jgi:uncharacterized protein YecT (DUF1311 family)
MLRSFLLALALLSAAASPASALDCSSPVTTVDILECVGRDIQSADRRLNDAYQKLMKDPDRDETGRNLLREAQRKWIPFRDAQCALEGDQMRGGTGQRVLHASCLHSMTAEQAKKLEEMLQR